MRRKRVGYAKLGRSMQLNLANCSSLGGDNEMIPTLKLLAERHPDVDFTIVGRNSGEHPIELGLPSNVTNPWRYWAAEIRQDLNRAGLSHPNFSIEEHQHVLQIINRYTGPAIGNCDDVIMWLGQHGTANTPIPSIRDRSKLTKPYDWATLYASYLIKGINDWRDIDPEENEEILLNADARNYVKYRDAKWPWRYPVISQYNFISNAKHERYGHVDASGLWLGVNGIGAGDGIWTSEVQNVYARLEISSLLPGTPFGDTIQFNGDWSNRGRFGVVINETRRDVAPQKSRRFALRDWILPCYPDFVHGTWSEKTMNEVNYFPVPVALAEYIPRLQQVHSTFTTPASGSGWATAKPWEAFAAGVVCFFHPAYDVQDNILGDAPAELREFLRVGKSTDLARRLKLVHEDEDTFTWAVNAQRAHFDMACADLTYLKMIEARLDLDHPN